MNRSNPSTVVGGGEMNRATSSVDNIASSDGASDSRSSRNVAWAPVSTGSAWRQSLRGHGAGRSHHGLHVDDLLRVTKWHLLH